MFELIYHWLDAVGNGFFGYLFGMMSLLYANMGIMLSLTFGALILLRPVTNRLIAPRWRVWIWFVGWYCGFLIQIYSWFSKINFLPVSFRSLVIPRTYNYGGIKHSMPMFLPEAGKAGDYTVALPGGAEIPFHLSGAAVAVIGLLWVVSFVIVLIIEKRQRKALQAWQKQGRKMDWKEKRAYGIYKDNVSVFLCRNLPTAFVRFGNEEHWGDGIRFVICVPDDLPEERLRLVLLHEMEHLNQYHAWWKSTVTMVLYLLWWNPILWLAHRFTCRDMELACDEAVMAKLDEAGRREYARTLVDLGAGKHMWGAATSFGECDAALRVKNVVSWRPRTEFKDVLSVLLVIAMCLFFYGGSQMDKEVRAYMDQMNWIWYANGSALEMDLEARRGEDLEIVEVWERLEQPEVDDHYVHIRVSTGQWFLCYCRSDGQGGYDITSIRMEDHGPGPDLTKYRGIVVPDDVYKALYG